MRLRPARRCGHAATCVMTGSGVAGHTPLAHAQGCLGVRGPLIAYRAQLPGVPRHRRRQGQLRHAGRPLAWLEVGDPCGQRWHHGRRRQAGAHRSDQVGARLSDLVLIDSAINDIGQAAHGTVDRGTATHPHRVRGAAGADDPAGPAAAGDREGEPRPRSAGHRGVRGRAAQGGHGVSAVRIVDASSGWNPARDLSADGVHPNTAGMSEVAHAVRGTASSTFCAP